MKLTFRQYLPRDRGDCVRVFCSNIPHFFGEHELPDFETFVDSAECPYFVVERFDVSLSSNPYDGPPRPSKQDDPGESTASEGHRTAALQVSRDLKTRSEIVGCGGYGIRDGSDSADLCWGMIASDYHGSRFGEYLLLARLNEIVTRESVRAVCLSTSQHTEGFFQKYGFAIQSWVSDGIGDGLDDVKMQLDLTEDTRRRVTALWHDVAR